MSQRQKPNQHLITAGYILLLVPICVFGQSAKDDQKIEKTLEVIGDIRPELKDKIEHNPEQARQIIKKYKNLGPISYLLSIKAKNTELYQIKINEFRLKNEIEQISKHLKLARKKNKMHLIDELTQKLHQKFSAQYDLKIQEAQIKVKSLKGELGEAESELLKMIARRQSHVREQMTQHVPIKKEVETNNSTQGKYSALDQILPDEPQVSSGTEEIKKQDQKHIEDEAQKIRKAPRNHLLRPRHKAVSPEQRVSMSQWRDMSREERAAYLESLRRRLSKKRY